MGMDTDTDTDTVDRHRVCHLKCWAVLLAVVVAAAAVVVTMVHHTAVDIHIQAVAAA